ncbi:MAG TPA: bifunctional riboflavin kinase/FAD synthetase, partial [Campylobacterales bacterium]|nr:bifunctional riboflavin kinase/FAD synthetase [Campylobacterales bacterium]
MQLTNTITSIAIGSFDGIHQAHQALISQAEAVVIIEQNCCTLTPGYTRTEQIQKPCFFYHFDKIKLLSVDAFIEQITQDFPKLETIIVGYDFGFGYKKEGNTT